MSTLVVSDRHIDFFVRCVEFEVNARLCRLADYDSLESKIINESGILSTDSLDNLKLELSVDYDDGENNDDLVLCASVFVSFNEKHFSFIDTLIIGVFSDGNTEFTMNVDYLKELRNFLVDIQSQSFHKCDTAFCYSLAEYERKCQECFKYHTTIEEACPVCLENEGHFVQLSCSHTIHFACAMQLRQKKCPLCRSKLVVSKNI